MRILKIVTSFHRLPEILLCRAATPQWMKLTASYIGFPVTLPFDIELRTGTFRFTTVADVRTFWLVFFSRTYDVRPGDRLIIDAGANIGTFTLYALLNAPESRVIAIEPAPDTCERLRKVIHEHGFSSRCVIYQAALGPQDGSTTMDLRSESQFRSTGGGNTSVPVFTLDSIVQDAAVDLLKLDIEGSEYSILAPAPPRCLKHIQRITMEYHPNGSPGDITPPVERAGLKCVSLRDDGGGYGLAGFERIS
jgi:FkbM family methyltransferase